MASEDIFEDFSEEYKLDNNGADESLDKEREEIENVEAQVDQTAKLAKPSVESRLLQLPLTRIRNLVKLDPDVNLASNEAIFAVSRATELFIKSLALESYNYTAGSKKKTVQRRDVDMAISSVDSLFFLEGTMNF